MQRVSPRAVAISTFVMLTLDVVGGFVLVFLLGGSQLDDSLSQEQVRTALQQIGQSEEFILASLLYGTFTSVLGGYFAARLARRYPYFNAAALGLLGLVIGLATGGEAPWWFTAIGIVTTIPAALLGGHIASRQGLGGSMSNR